MRAFLVDAKYPDASGREPVDAKLGMIVPALGVCVVRGLLSAVAQFYGLVEPGLILSRHIFKGLERPLCVDDRMNADGEKLIYSWRPRWDYEWQGGPGGSLRRILAPTRSVFVVIATPNVGRYRDEFPDAVGWIERWNWVEEDPVLSEAPRDWVDRYHKKLWTRET